MAKVHGSCDARFKEVEKLLQSYLGSGEELGASIVVNLDGKDVVDIWGGHADKNRTREWEENTITTVYSTSKTVASLAALMLIDRGLLSPYEKVSTYWPEFGTNGKEDVEVRHFLSHTAGVPGWENPMTMEDVYDVPKATALLAQQAPWWTPGTASGYHSLTMGNLIGELVRRTTGKSLGKFIVDEIAVPLGADFQLGAAEKDWPRIAELIPPPTIEDIPADMDPSSMDPGSVAAKVFTNPKGDASMSNTPAWRQAELGAANGHSNARGVARMLSVISLGGTAGGKQLLSPETIDLIFQEQSKGMDLVVRTPIRFGIGYGLTGKDTFVDWLPDGQICFWGGWGGSIVIMDVERRMTISYVMNKMENAGIGNDRTKAYVRAVYKAVGAL